MRISVNKAIFCIVFISNLFCASSIIASILSIDGPIQIIDADNDRITKAYKGSSIYSNSIIRTNKGTFCKIIFEDKNTLIIIDQNSEVKFSENQLARSFTINYGSMYIKNIDSDAKKTMIFTDASQNKLSTSDIWINIIGTSGDELYVLDGSASTYNYKTKSRITANSGNVIYSYSDGFFDSISYDIDDLPKYIDNEQLLHLEKKNVNLLSKEKIKPDDLIPLFDGESDNIKLSESDNKKGIGFELSTSATSFSDNMYAQLGVNPTYNSLFFNIRLNLDGYFPISSDAKDINKYNDIFDVLGTIEYARYKSFNQNFILQIGNLWGLTFGHGNLLKEYSNMLDYPRIKKTGIYLFYRTNKRDIKVDLFISDIQEINKSGGLFGVRGSILISNKFPLTLGLGFIQDNNQFSSINDYIDDPQIIEEFSISRKVNAIQFDYTFDLFDREFLDTRLYGEFVGISYPEELYYIRDDRTIEDQGDYVDEIADLGGDLQFKRRGSWEIANGLWFDYREKFELKTSINLSSALHIPQYFGSTYDFEKARPMNLTPKDNREFSPGAQDVSSLLQNYLYEGDISDENAEASFIFPKEIFSMMQSTQIKYPAIGLSMNSIYYFRDIINISLNFSFYKEIDKYELLEEDFFNYHFSINLKDNVFEGVSEARLYYTQFFSNQLLGSEYEENMLRGIRIGYNFWKNCHIILDVHDVFYDINLDNDVDLLRTSIAQLKVNF